MNFFPRQKLNTYRVKTGRVFIHPRTGERIYAGAELTAYPQDILGQEEKLNRFPLTTRAIRSQEFRGS